MITATWRPDMASLYKNVDAQKVAEEIVAIGEEVTPEDVVNEARDPETELHKCFEWDNDIAAEKWRKQQARQIFCNLVIKRVDVEEDKPQEPIRFFYNTEGKSYKTAEKIFSQPSEYEKLLQQAKADALAYQRKYSSLLELEEIMIAINKLVA